VELGFLQPTEGGPMSEEPTQRDLEIRAAIDELSEANENVQRMLDEVRRWQQQNPPPAPPRSVRSMAEVEDTA
jgi:hypothetical protein